MAWRYSRKTLCLLPFILPPLSVGCRSSVSTHVAPSPDGVGWSTKRMRGVPITVKVPTHIRLEIVEEQYVVEKDGCKNYILQTGNGIPLKSRRVVITIQERDEVFTVDVARPASGKLTYSATMKDQYFDTLNSNVDDNTIKTITQIIGGANASLTPIKGQNLDATQQNDSKANLPTTVTGVVAAMIFDLRDPCLDDRVREFLAQHINDCHHCPNPTVGNCPQPYPPIPKPVQPGAATGLPAELPSIALPVAPTELKK